MSNKNFYLVEIGVLSKKGNWLVKHELHIVSENSETQLKDYYSQKYSGFTVGVSKIAEVDINKEQSKLVIINRTDVQTYHFENNELFDLLVEFENKVNKMKEQIKDELLNKYPFLGNIVFVSGFKRYNYRKKELGIDYYGTYKLGFKQTLGENQ